MSRNLNRIFLTSVLVVVVVIAVGIGAYYVQFISRQSSPSSSSSSTILVSSSTATSTNNVTSSTSIYLTSWTTIFTSGLNSTINQPVYLSVENASLNILVRYFYYNSTALHTFNVSTVDQISSKSAKGTYDASSEFAVAANTSLITLGGSNNSNEGISVNYSIMPKAGANGTYGFNLGFLYPSMQECAADFLLVVGNWATDYGLMGSCTAPLSNHYPLNSEGYVNGFLFTEIVELSNSTK